MRRLGVVWAVVACLASLRAAAADSELRYRIELLDGRPAVFEIPLEIEHPGDLEIVADWGGNRLLSLRLDSARGIAPSVRRSGPAPIRLKVPVPEVELGGGPWTLTIRALPVGGSGEGLLIVRLPRDPRVLARERKRAAREESAQQAPSLESWQLPAQVPRSIDTDVRDFVLATERFRSWIVDRDSPDPDACRWQDDLLRWLAERRDAALENEGPLDDATAKLLARLSDAVVEVGRVRSGDDPILHGPVPEEPQLRVGWNRLRASRLEPLEQELDSLLQTVQRDYVPTLTAQDWPVRMISCLMAAERHFEQAVVVGPDAAPNRDLARTQWEPMTRAGAALKELAELAGEEPIRLSPRRR